MWPSASSEDDRKRSVLPLRNLSWSQRRTARDDCNAVFFAPSRPFASQIEQLEPRQEPERQLAKSSRSSSCLAFLLCHFATACNWKPD
eukprot:395723-Amphidinium_carterae.1